MDIKQIKGLAKLFKERGYGAEPEVIPLGDRRIVLDPANVLGFIPKTNEARQQFIEVFDVGTGLRTIPEMDKFTASSKYSIEYL
ncbi:hypothetical protein KKI23_02505, partial [Patescibacteria group bacterium]|nr:hypothetical protein [Patescibacteria group bacterium]